MKKNKFLEGAMIATIGIVICKIIGLIYVIPFYAIIGKQGGSLYSYAYSIYAIFLSLSTSGIPIAMSKVVSEYNALGYYYTKEKAYKLGSKFIMMMGFIFFLLLMVFAPQIAYLIIGDMKGGNTIEGVAFVIRIVSTALLVVPLLSVTKGYLQGHKIMTPSSIANILEQLVRVVVIVAGSFMAVKVFNLSIETAVGIAVFAATIGALVAYFYVYDKIRKNKAELKRNEKITREEAKITTKEIVLKIVFYALPFIAIDLINSLYSMVDTLTVVKTMTNLGYNAIDTETTIGVISSWATKLNMIIISIALGLNMSLIPNITSSYVKRDMKDVTKKINQALQMLVFIVIPMTIGIHFLSRPVWISFYGYDNLSIEIFKLFIFQALTFSFYSVLINITQALNARRLTITTLVTTFLIKVILNVPFMNLFAKIHIPVYYAPTVVTLLSQLIGIGFLLYMINKKFKVSYTLSLNNIGKSIVSVMIMYMVLLIINLFVPIDSINRFGSILEIIVFAIIGAVVYFICTFKSGVIDEIFGKDMVNKVLRKVFRKRAH